MAFHKFTSSLHTLIHDLHNSYLARTLIFLSLFSQTTSDVREDVPFLALSEENKLILFPLVLLHKEASSAGSSFPWTDLTHVSAMNECPLEKWVHVGCEVCSNT